MNKYFEEVALKCTGAKFMEEVEVIQNLWSGYGKIVRYKLFESEFPSVVVKHVRLPVGGNHPRGWNTDYSHQRKVKSYQVEMAWYNNFSVKCDDSCRVPKCFGEATLDDEVLMVLEDLDSSGFYGRKNTVTWNDIDNCLDWLANFHATFLNEKPEGLWSIGTYWHLDTRPDELEELSDHRLKNAAPIIDRKLNECKYLTLVHGDAKLANFCFSDDDGKVAAVDFQYVGGGCGMKDVAYFVGSCLYEEDCEKYEERILNTYFELLNRAVEKRNLTINLMDLEKEWREMYAFAWTDFHRFLKGWSPDHWKINSYSEKVSNEVISSLEPHTF